ncbi:dihydrolipoamide acetyltransferase family protein [Gilvibacter sp.]|uniref:dihydrolipoamide acetyltransferase family protein n=1 Tax=Gilvibacter sp. TaxID=2729997 RepID=UPI0035BE4F9C
MKKHTLTLPRMGESITEGTLLNWLVGEGETFAEGDILCEVATDKVDNEVPAPAPGTLIKHLAAAKEVVAVGAPLAELELSDVVVVKAEAPIAAAPVSAAPKTSKPKKKLATGYTVNENIFVSPLIEAIAREHHISFEELARIPATGNEGRLRKSDVMQYIADGRPYQFVQPTSDSGFKVPDLKFDKGTGERVPMDRMRQMIADHMVFSKHTSPHVTAYVEADLTAMSTWRKANKAAFMEKHGQKLTFTPLFIQAIAKAIQDFPNINSSLDGEDIIIKDHINIGMATALPSGNLIVPVVKDADKLSLAELAAETNRLALAAREGNLKADDTQGSTFTISNVGTFGSLMGTPIINQPEAAILATGIIKKRAEVIEYPEGDKIEIREMMYLSLSFDHRIVDGFLAGSFLRRIADYMEQYDSNKTI